MKVGQDDREEEEEEEEVKNPFKSSTAVLRDAQFIQTELDVLLFL